VVVIDKSKTSTAGHSILQFMFGFVAKIFASLFILHLFSSSSSCYLSHSQHSCSTRQRRRFRDHQRVQRHADAGSARGRQLFIAALQMRA
jgi:hypothetical protein